MRIALTGASGLLGANVASELLAHGHQVRATRRASTRVDHLSDLAIEWVDGRWVGAADPRSEGQAVSE